MQKHRVGDRNRRLQRQAASSSPWSTFLSEVRSDPPHAQPINETFALKIRPRILNIHSTPRLLCASGSYLVHSGPYICPHSAACVTEVASAMTMTADIGQDAR